MFVTRPRLSERLALAATRPITLLSAPAGYGKSVALDAYLATLSGDVVRFDVLRTHASIPRFVRAFAAALEPRLPRVGQSLAIAYERARQSPKASDVLAAWLAEHLEAAPLTVAIDDFHHCETDRAIAALLASTIDKTRGSVRWIVATRSSAELPLATWLSRGEAALPIDDELLRLTSDDARELGALLLPGADAETIDRLRATTGGAIGIFSFAARTIAREPAAAGRLLASGGGDFERYAGEVLRRLSPEERRLLIDSAAFPEIDETAIGSTAEDAAILAGIVASEPQIFQRRASGVRYLNDLFAAELRIRLHDLGPDAVRDASSHAARTFERNGRIAEALASHLRERRDAEIVRVVETYGLEFFGSGRGESIQEAIDALDPLVQMTSSVVLGIKAMSDSAIGRFDTAESWFQLAINRAEGPLRAQLSYQYGTHLLRFFRHEAARVFEEILADATIPEALRAYTHAALGPAYVFEHRSADAIASANAGVALARTLELPHLLAKSCQQASFVELFADGALRAKALASEALAVATERGFYDIAAGALSVLYNVASDIDDDPVESVRLLDAMYDCAAKSGSLTNQLHALCSTLEIRVEGGDEEAADRIEARLRDLDVSLAGRTIYEALLPSRAMRAAWAGDFLGAYRLLSKSADQQWSPDRKALRLAEIAFYAAAAGSEREAAAAIGAALETLATVETVDLRVQRTRLVLALAATVLGRAESATEILEQVDLTPDRLSPRLVALRRTLHALHERYAGARNQFEVLAELDELSRHGFAGLGRALAMIPLADNAMRRLGVLSHPERALVVRWADGDATTSEPRLRTIARRLGCADTAALRRAAVWHRAALDGAAEPARRHQGVR